MICIHFSLIGAETPSIQLIFLAEKTPGVPTYVYTPTGRVQNTQQMNGKEKMFSTSFYHHKIQPKSSLKYIHSYSLKKVIKTLFFLSF